MKWVTRSFNDTYFDDDRDEYKYVAHCGKKEKVLPWLVCQRCGLIYLKNAFTHWSIDKGCKYDSHPSFRKERAKKGRW